MSHILFLLMLSIASIISDCSNLCVLSMTAMSE